jgi:hypothetical protein
MKRDIDLIRRILLFIEADEVPPRVQDGWAEGVKVGFADVPPSVLTHHIVMLSRAGLIEIQEAEDARPPAITSLTWRGYDYLDEIRHKHPGRQFSSSQ